MAKLEVEIGAEVDGLKKGLSDAQKALKQFQGQASKIESSLKKNSIATAKLARFNQALSKAYKDGKISLERYNAGLSLASSREKQLSNQSKNLTKDLRSVNASAKSLQSSMSNAGGATANAVPAVTEFSRVIQDAPFGIQGVANNITQLTQQFGNLKSATGSTGGALKAMLATLTGPAGILLAVSAITSAWIAYADSQRKAKKEADALTDATKEGVGSAESELATVKSYLKIANDRTKSDEQRNRALKEAKELSDGYLDSVTLETLAVDQGAEAVGRYTDALLRQAKIKGAQQVLSDLNAKIFEETAKGIGEQVDTFDALLAQFKNFGNIGDASLDLVDKGTKNLNDSLQSTKDQISEVEKALQGLLESDTSAPTPQEAEEKKGKKIDPFKEAKDRVKRFDFYNQKAREAGLKAVEIQTQNDAELAQARLEGINVQDQIDEAERIKRENRALEIQSALIDLNNKAKSIIDGALTNTFAGIGTAIGNSLSGAGNSLNNLGSMLLGALGGLLVQLGQMAIQIGVGLIGIKTALKSLNPAVAIAGGVALIALGKMFSNKSKEMAGSIGGGGGRSSGGVGRSSFASAGGGGATFGGSSTTASSTGAGSGSGRVVFEIAGTRLLGVLQNTTRRNASLSGNYTLSGT